MNVSILIPAAGASSRMQGRDKLTESVEGMPLLRRQASLACQLGSDVTVALPPRDHPFCADRVNALNGLDLTHRHYPASRDGLGGTISDHVKTLEPSTEYLMVFLPDLIELTLDDLQTMLGAADQEPVRAATADGDAGHPVVFPACLFEELAHCPTNDSGPRSVLRRHAPRLVPLPDQHALRDLDTPEDWEAWRAERAGSAHH